MNKVLSDEELRSLNFGEVMNRRYTKRSESRPPSLTRIDSHNEGSKDIIDLSRSIKKRLSRKLGFIDKISVTVSCLAIMAISIPFLMFCGMIIGITTAIDALVDIAKAWFKR